MSSESTGTGAGAGSAPGSPRPRRGASRGSGSSGARSANAGRGGSRGSHGARRARNGDAKSEPRDAQSTPMQVVVPMGVRRGSSKSMASVAATADTAADAGVTVSTAGTCLIALSIVLGLIAMSYAGMQGYIKAVDHSTFQILSSLNSNAAQEFSSTLDSLGLGTRALAAAVRRHRVDADQANMDAYLVDAIAVFGSKVEAMYYGNATGAWHSVSRNGTQLRLAARSLSSECLREYAVTSSGARGALVQCQSAPNPDTRPWYIYAVEQDRQAPVLNVPYRDFATLAPVVTVSTLIKIDGSVVGVAAMDIRLDWFNAQAASIRTVAVGRLAKARSSAFVDNQNYVLFSAGSDVMIASTVPADQQLLSAATSSAADPIPSVSSAGVSWQARGLANWQASCAATSTCDNTTMAGQYTVAATASPIGASSIAAGMDWIVTVSTREADYTADREGTIVTSVAAGVVSLMGCFVMWLALHDCPCGKACQRNKRTGTDADLGDVALTDLGESRPRTKTLSKPLAATIVSRKKPPRWKQWLATIIFVGTLVVMGFTYLSWGAGSAIVNEDVARISRAVSLQLAAGVNEFTRAATELVDTEIGAFERRELPITDEDLLDRRQTAALEAFMYDLYTVYATSRTPVAGVFVGYDNDDFFMCTYNTTGGVNIVFRDNSTANERHEVWANSDGTRGGPSDRLPIAYWPTLRSWYTKSELNRTVWTDVYQFAGTNDFGITAARRWIDPVSGRTLVFAVDMLINTLETVMENFGLDPNAGALYVMQPGTTAASVGTVVAASVTHSPRNGVFHPNGQVVGIDSNSSLIQQSAGAINASLTGQDLLIATGWGVNRLLVNVLSVQLPGLQWALVVVLKQTMLREFNGPLDTVTFMVGMGSIGVVGLVVVIAMSAPRRAGTAKAKADVFSDVKGAGGASKIQHLLPLVEATMQEAPVRALHKDVCEFFSVLAQSSLEYGRRQSVETKNPLNVPEPQVARVQARTGKHVLWHAAAYASGSSESDMSALSMKRRHRIVQWVVTSALGDNNPLRHVHTVLANDFNTARIAMFETYDNVWYGRFIVSLIVAQMLTVFWEGQPNADTELRTPLLVTEGVLLLMLVIDMCMYWVVHWVRTRSSLGILSKAPLVRELEHLVVGKHHLRRNLGLVRSVLLVAMVLDWVVQATRGYATGPTVPGFTADSPPLRVGTYMISYTWFCRPLLLYTVSKDLRRATNHLAITVVRSYVVWALTFSFLVVAALLGVALLQNAKPPADGPQFETGEGRAFQDARTAFIQMFIFVCTAANYPLIADPAASQSQFYYVFFFICSFIGLFLIVSLMVAYFQKHFGEALSTTTEFLEQQDRVRRRSGLMLAFYLMNSMSKEHNRTERARSSRHLSARGSADRTSLVAAVVYAKESAAVVPPTLFDEFFETCGMGTDNALKSFGALRVRYEACELDAAKTFAQLKYRLMSKGCDQAFVETATRFAERCSSVYRGAQVPVSANAFSVMTFITHCERRCDTFGVPPVDEEGALMEQRLAAARNGAKPVTVGDDDTPRRFTLCSTSWLRDYFDDKLVVPYESSLVMMVFLHVINLAVIFSDPSDNTIYILLTFSALHILDVSLRLVAEGSVWWFKRLEKLHNTGVKPFADTALRFDVFVVASSLLLLVVGLALPKHTNMLLRLAETIPAMRLLSVVSATRRLVFGLIGSLPTHYAFFGLLAVILYTYAVIGTLMLGGLMDTNAVNFNSMASATGALLQILTGESWHAVMYRAIDATNRVVMSFYFISLVALVILLFANIFIGIVVDSFQELDDADEESDKSIRARAAVTEFASLHQEVQARRIIGFMSAAKGKVRLRRPKRASRSSQA